MLETSPALADLADNVFDFPAAADPLARANPPNRATSREIAPDDWLRYEGYVGEILAALGMDLDTPGTRKTPERFLSALFDATSGYEGDSKLVTAFPAEGTSLENVVLGQITEGPIAFSSLCEHHALPFLGVAHVGYVADQQIIGISKLTRLVRVFSRRFTVQERLGEQIADTLEALVDPLGVAVHLEAAHLCTRVRGVEEDSSTVTTFWRGAFSDADLRREFLDEVRSRRGSR